MATASVDLETIIDADGHLFEDPEGISALMPPGYRERGPFELGRLFPPLDHLHSAALVQLAPATPRSGFVVPAKAGTSQPYEGARFPPSRE